MGASALAPPQVVDVTLALFAGTKTDITPSDCPEGISPDTQDGIYLPGGWFSRPCLHRLYPAGHLTAGSQVLYEKTYVQPNNQALTLLLTSDGILWLEELNLGPGSPGQLSQVAAGLYAQSVTADGREYIAFSDLLHGQGVPLQYDGTNLDRVTMDGPGASPAIADSNNTLPIGSAFNYQNGVAFNANQAVESGNTVTITTNVAHGFIPGQFVIVIIPSLSFSPQIGVQQVIACPSTTTFTYIVDALGLASAGPGNVYPAVGYIGLTGLSGAPAINVGDPLIISGNGGGLNNSGAGIVLTGDVDTDATGFIVSWVSGNQFSASMNGQVIEINGVTSTVESVTSPTSLTLTGPVTANQSGVTYSAPLSNPPTWPVVSITNAGGGTWSIGFSLATYPIGSFPNSAGPNGSVFLGGQSSPGVHQVVCMWLTRQGWISPPSPPIRFASVGNSQWKATNLPIGPSNVVARILGFTGAGGDNFFVIPASVTLPNPSAVVATPIVIQSTIVPDNTSTSWVFDVPDDTLFAAVAIDQVGNDLFDQRVLGPVLGFFSYASRLMCWGDYQKIENLLNLGFCGGYLSGVLTTPLGWTVVSAGGTLATNFGPWLAGMFWQVTGDGTTNPKGQLSQSAYQDAYGTAIALPSTLYSFRLWAQASAANLAGNVVAEFTSASTGFSSTATIPVASLSSGLVGAFTPIVQFTNELPAIIPADLLFQIYVINLPAGATVSLAELEPIYTQNPYNNTLARISYALNPEAFAQTTGNLGASDDDSAVQCLALLRKPTLLQTLEGIHIFQDNDGEPDTWEVDSLTRAVGCVSLRGGDPGRSGTGDAAEDWALIASRNQPYLFAGGEFWPIGQEITRGNLPQSQDPRPTWSDITPGAMHTIVAKNDPAKRRAYFALPLNGALTPNYIATFDYRELVTASQIASSPPVHITIQGKMKSSDLTRKWSWWNISANDMEILVRPNDQRDFYIAGGARNAGAFGNIYSLDPAYLTDDDYGQMYPYYTTYAFTDHDQEQALGLGSDSHLYKKVHAFIAGVGQVMITPISGSLYNFLPSLSPRTLVGDTNAGNFLANDLEWTAVGVRGDRVFFRIWVLPLPGATDVQIRLQKFIVGMMKDPIVQYRQSGV